MPMQQRVLPFHPVRNSGLFSIHVLERRLHLEPECTEQKKAAQQALNRLAALCRTERNRVEHYLDEAVLEQAFIQPVLEELGWKLKYQTFLQNRKPDYALFLDDASYDAALRAGRNSPEFCDYSKIVGDWTSVS